jgi:hypothetical protein
MTAEPYDEWAVSHLNWAVFCGSFYVFVDFTRPGRTNAPPVRAVEIAGKYEPPAG